MARQIVAAVFLLAGLALFVSLGVWQLHRLTWKEGIIAEVSARIAAPAVALPAAPDPEKDDYLAVAVSGVMGPQELDVLVSTRDWGPGFRIISPFTTDDGRRIMVDRGFVPDSQKTAARMSGPMTIEGNLHWPNERDMFTPADDSVGNWWYARDVPVLADELGTEPVLVVARVSPDSSVWPLPVNTEGIRNAHFQYAMTWFLLAATWVVMTGYALWRIRRRNA